VCGARARQWARLYLALLLPTGHAGSTSCRGRSGWEGCATLALKASELIDCRHMHGGCETTRRVGKWSIACWHVVGHWQPYVVGTC
jgi:hypothetical protein